MQAILRTNISGIAGIKFGISIIIALLNTINYQK